MSPETLDVWTRALTQALAGVPMTLMLAFGALGIGGLLAIPLAMVHARHDTWGAKAVRFYTFFFTGTPLLVQLYLLYDGVGGQPWVMQLQTTETFSFLRDGYFWMMLGLVLNTCAYTIIIVSGAIKNTDNGQVEAARAYGFSRFAQMRHIVLPSSLRRALPAYSNEVILMIQATALASTLTIFEEITGQAIRFNTMTYQPFAAFVSAGLMYLLITFVLVGVFKGLEKKYLAYLKPRAH